MAGAPQPFKGVRSGLTCLCWSEEGETSKAVAGDAGAARGEHWAQGLQTRVQRPLWNTRVPLVRHRAPNLHGSCDASSLSTTPSHAPQQCPDVG